jgi:signal transduction histidine kinase
VADDQLRAAEDPRQRALCRLIFNFRLIALSVTLLWAPTNIESFGLILAALTVAAAASWFPIKFWDRLGPTIMKHPAYLGADMVLGMGMLLLLGPQSPFVYYTLGTALLGGALYRSGGAVFFSALQCALYWLVLFVRPDTGADTGFQVLVGLPALYPLAATSGAGVRGLLDKQAATEAALVRAERTAAVERERARIAREMHDSLGKTIQGVALSATSLPAWAQRDPKRAGAEARRIADSARIASAEARSLLENMRADALGDTLDRSLSRYVETWSDRTGVAALCEAVEVPFVCPEVRWEVFCIAREALRNVERHSGADKVRVLIHGDDEGLLLGVSDDGSGFDAGRGIDELREAGHFGMIGMKERAARVGGRLELVTAPGEGTEVSVVVPSPGDFPGRPEN